jgi:hypothetical protein
VSETGEDRTVEQPVVEAPSVSTAPPPSLVHRWWSSIPSHLGPARTSTAVLGVLFLLIGTLYLNVRPDPIAPVTPTGGTVQSTTPARTTVAPTTAVPTTTEPVPTTAESSTPTEATTTSAVPTETGTEEPTDTVVPTTEAPTTAPTTAPPTTPPATAPPAPTS